MREIAVIARITDVIDYGRKQYGTSLDNNGRPRCTHLELTMLGEPSLNYCSNHPRLVWFDGEACPCCGLMGENKKLFE